MIAFTPHFDDKVNTIDLNNNLNLSELGKAMRALLFTDDFILLIFNNIRVALFFALPKLAIQKISGV